MSRALFIVQETRQGSQGRYYVKDKDGNILFITELNDPNPEETAIKWAIMDGGWMAGLLEDGNIPSSIHNRIINIDFQIGKPLYIVLDNYGNRFLVVDDDDNVVFLTDLDDHEPEQTATYAAMQLGGWLKGAVKRSH